MEAAKGCLYGLAFAAVVWVAIALIGWGVS